ncbi:protease synthase and sporulation protein PAI 2 [Robertmurraya siralis]|uniref:Protease synthase and sporulation protein PAI 2 n=1 Tax=Robertmurraya siralis TaxID=77777 RepID=A0A919WL91_9BACI|nr:FMN-binding negative transcriptional regulator [Robertmurraya siralis]GIN64170.1 protease synthase and sporulation protein PAI 2 [Robertmurraya siralis]
MYIPSYFKIDDKATMLSLIKDYSFATLFSIHDGIPVATHLPLILNRDNIYLYGHFARPNPQWKDIKAQTVLVIFHGPHCYISPSWYETNQAVPTWNYVTVHIYGEVEWVENEQELNESLHEIVSKYEPPNSPYNLEEIDDAFLSGMNKGIQGFKIKINKIEGKAKLSQNHPEERQRLVATKLEQCLRTDEQEIAKLMKENLKKELY